MIIEIEPVPGGHAALHVHYDIDESSHLLSGRIAVRCGNDTLIAQAGDYVCQLKEYPTYSDQ